MVYLYSFLLVIILWCWSCFLGNAYVRLYYFCFFRFGVSTLSFFFPHIIIIIIIIIPLVIIIITIIIIVVIIVGVLLYLILP